MLTLKNHMASRARDMTTLTSPIGCAIMASQSEEEAMTRQDIRSLTVAQFEALPAEAKSLVLEEIVEFWQENARRREAEDYRMVGSTPSYAWGE